MAKRKEKKAGDVRLKIGKRIIPVVGTDWKKEATYYMRAFSPREILVQMRLPSGTWYDTNIV